MEVEISFAKLEDAKQLAEIDKIANKEFKWWHPDSRNHFEKLVKKSKYFLVVAKMKNNIIGYLEAKFKDGKDTIWIENIFTLKEYRKNSVAKQLIKKFVKHWKNKVNNIVLLTADRNKEIFERLGFKKTMNYMEFVG